MTVAATRGPSGLPPVAEAVRAGDPLFRYWGGRSRFGLPSCPGGCRAAPGAARSPSIITSRQFVVEACNVVPHDMLCVAMATHL